MDATGALSAMVAGYYHDWTEWLIFILIAIAGLVLYIRLDHQKEVK